MKIITLVENTKPENSPLEARFGLGLYIETNGISLLFDNGPDDAFVHNASLLGIDIAAVDLYVLSHAHYDHGGGLETFLTLNSKATVYLSEYASDQCYSVSKSSEARYIGLHQEIFDKYPSRFQFVRGRQHITQNIHLYAVEDFNTFRPRFNSLLYTKREGAMTADDFRHELVMSVTENGENTIFCGCAHSGVLNMVKTVKKHQPDIPVKTLTGGFHLLNTATKTLGETPDTVLTLAKSLQDEGVAKIYTGHCTGDEGFRLLKSVLGDLIEPLTTGKVIQQRP